MLSANLSERLERSQPSSLKELSERLRVDRGKFPQPRVITVAFGGNKPGVKVGPLRRGNEIILAHIEIGDIDNFKSIRAKLEDVCEFWVVDKKVLKALSKNEYDDLYSYDDDVVVVKALADAIQLFKINKASLIGESRSQRQELSGFVELCRGTETPDALVACSQKTPAQPLDVRFVREGGLILLLQAGALSEQGYLEARSRKLTIWRVDCGLSLLYEVERIINTITRFNRALGRVVLPGGLTLVAGGIVGEAGDIVVDDCQRPRFLLGESDGRGGLRPLKGERELKIQQWIIENWSI